MSVFLRFHVHMLHRMSESAVCACLQSSCCNPLRDAQHCTAKGEVWIRCSRSGRQGMPAAGPSWKLPWKLTSGEGGPPRTWAPSGSSSSRGSSSAPVWSLSRAGACGDGKCTGPPTGESCRAAHAASSRHDQAPLSLACHARQLAEPRLFALTSRAQPFLPGFHL